MTIARDASSPARFTMGAVSNTASGTSASFTPPANAWVYAGGCFNSAAGASPTFSNPTNTGGGLGSWSLVKSQVNASGGSVAIWRAFVNSSVATTVTISVANGDVNANIGTDSAAWVDVWTGAATSQTGAATTGGTSTTQNISPTITTTASGSQVAGVAIDWNALGAPTSTDTIDSYTVIQQTSGGRAYKASNSGAAGSVALNFDAAGAGPQWAYALYEILAPAGIVSDPPWWLDPHTDEEFLEENDEYPTSIADPFSTVDVLYVAEEFGDTTEDDENAWPFDTPFPFSTVDALSAVEEPDESWDDDENAWTFETPQPFSTVDVLSATEDLYPDFDDEPEYYPGTPDPFSTVDILLAIEEPDESVDDEQDAIAIQTDAIVIAVLDITMLLEESEEVAEEGELVLLYTPDAASVVTPTGIHEIGLGFSLMRLGGRV